MSVRAWALVFMLCAGVLRVYRLPDAGVIYMDDLRSYAGLEFVDAESFESARRGTISATGGRPLLAWLTAVPAWFGARRVGMLFVPNAVMGVLAVGLLVLLLRRMFPHEPNGALFAGLILAVSGTAVNYSRSGLTPMPAMVCMLLGLLPLARDPITHRQAMLCGLAFAGVFLLHPGYVLYFAVPVTFIFLSTANLARRVGLCMLVLAPTPLAVLAYDAPNALPSILRGRFDLETLDLSLTLGRLFWNFDANIRGSHEGISFWPEYLIAAEGPFGAGVWLMLTALGAVVDRRDVQRQRLLFWAIVPWCLWLLWLSVNAYGRLYAPLLLPAVALAGFGASAAVRALRRLVPTTVAITLIVLVLAVPGLERAGQLIRHPGLEPALAEQIAATTPRAVAWLRADERALAPLSLRYVSVPAELIQAYCEGYEYLVLSPASLYLMLRHYDFLSNDLKLAPVVTGPSPFVVSMRLFEGQTPGERELVGRSALLRQLGLYRIMGINSECADVQ